MKIHQSIRGIRASIALRLLALIFLLSPPIVMAQGNITAGATFGGMDQGYTDWGPISPNGDVGPNYICQGIDTYLAIFSKSGQFIEAQDMSKFAGGDGLNQTVVYDPLAQRWVMCGGVSTAFFGVSNSSDPTQGWTEQHALGFPGSGDGGRFGFNASAYFVVYPSHPTNPNMIIIDKSSVLDKNNSTFTSYNVINAPGANTLMEDDTTTGNPSDPMWFYDATHLYAMTNYLSSSPTVTTYNVTGGTIVVSKYAEIRNGQLMCINDLGALNWSLTNIATATVVQSGTIPIPAGYSNTNYNYCSLGANGDIGVTFMAYSTDGQRTTMFVTGRAASDPPGTMRTPVAVETGSHTGNRMGDYGSVHYDPATGTFWAVHNPDNGSAYSAISNFGVSNLPATPLPEVTGLGILPSSGTNVNLQWNAVPGATGYQILSSTDDVTFNAVATLSNSATNYTDTPAAPVTAYYYEVVASNTNTQTNSAAPAVANVVLAPTPPAYDGLSAPSGLAASSGSGNAVQLSWNSITGGTGFYIERAGNGVTWTRVATTGTGVLQYADSNPVGSNLYFYRVGTLDSSGGQSAPCTPVSITNGASAPPQVSIGNLWPNEVQLRWSYEYSASGFTISRSTGGVNYTVIGTSPANYDTYTDAAGVVPGTQYYYQVVANNAVGNSLPSTVTVTPLIYAPGGVTITQGAGQLTLNWSAVSGAVDYQVQRSMDGTNFSTISTATSTSYADTGATPLEPYYYRILTTGSGVGNTSVPSAVVFGVVPTALPSPWQSKDIGLNSSVAGGAGYNASTGAFTLAGCGGDIWGTSDQFHYVYQTLNGNGTIVARVATQQATGTYPKAGVMIRNSTAASDQFAMMEITPSGAYYQYRVTSGSSAATVASTGGVTAPEWVKLVRTGNLFTAYISANGVTWMQEGTATIAMGTNVLIGLAEDSNDGNLLNVSTFDNVFVTPMTETDASLALTAGGGSGTVNILAGATGPSGATLSVIDVTQGASGTVVNNGNGTVTYTINSPYARSDTFTCTIGDGLGDTVTATVSVTTLGLDAYYPFVEGSGTTSADATGNGFTATLDGAAWTTGVGGGNALSFNGTSSYATIPPLNLHSNTVTIAGWVNRNGSQNAWTGLVFCRAGSTCCGVNFGTANELRYTWNSSDYTWNSGLTVPNAQWTFVALVITGSNATMYMQPQGGTMQSATNAVANASAAFDGVTDIGQDSLGSRFVNGSMTGVRIYNTALSGSAVAALCSDTPPTVATAAAASPNPVRGPRTNLSVLGATVNGESTLTYSWTATSIPSGAAVPSFSANWTNTAKSTVVDFYVPGSYTLTCTITDANGLSVASSVNVTVTQVQLAWTGGGGNANWSNAANWSGGFAPQWGDYLTLSGSSNDDMPAGTIFTSIILQGNNITLSGNQISVMQGSSPAIINSGTNNLIGNSILLDSNATVSASSGGLALTGTINNNGNQLTIAAAASTTVLIPGAMIGGGLIASGSGTVVLSGNNNYGGGTTINPGATLQVGIGGTNGSLGTGSIVDNGNLVYDYSSSYTMNVESGATISGSGSVSGTSGSVNFDGSTLALGGGLNFTQTSASGRYVGLQVGYGLSNVTLSGSSISLAGDLGYYNNQGGAMTLNTSATNGPINLNISIGRPGSWYSLNSFTANAGTGAINWTGSYATAGNQATPITLTGAIDFSGNFLCWSAETMTLDATEPSTVSGTFSGPLSLVVGGTSTLTLTGSNTYTGATTVNAGTLAVNGSITSSTTTVNSGATLSGTGTAGAVTVASGGTLVPGVSGTGPLSLNNHALSLSGTAALDINASTGGSTKVQGISAAAYGGTLNVTNLAGTLAAGNTFTLFSAASYSGSFSAMNLPALGAGLYWNTSNLAVNGSISVVGQTLTTIAVTPVTASLGSHCTQQFAATGYDQFSNIMINQPAFTWSNSGAGSVNSSGLYTASYASGTALVTASSGGVSGSASVTVTDVAPTVTVAATASPGTVTASTSNLSVSATGESALTYTWAATSMPSGATAPTYSANGTTAAQNTTAAFSKAGAYTFTVTVTDMGGLSSTSSVNVTVNQTFTSIAVTPATASVPSGQTQQFAAAANDQFSNSMSPQPGFTWSLTGTGTVNSSGLYTASYAAGTATVTASSGSVSGSASVTVTNTPPTVVTAASAAPNPLAGPRTNLSVLGADSNGNGASTLTYTWAATTIPSGAATPTFSANGTNAAQNSQVTVTSTGAYTFTATITDEGGATATSSCNVTVNQLQLLWTGTGGNSNWSNSSNWNGGLAPEPGDQLMFTGSANDNFSAGTAFTALTLLGSNIGLSGSQVTLTSGTNIAITSSGTNNSIAQAIQLGSSATISATNGTLTIAGAINNNGEQLTVSNATASTVAMQGVLSGTGSLTESGSGTLLLTAANTYSGVTTVNPGSTLQVGSGGATGSLGSGNIVDNGNLVYNYASTTYENVPSGTVISGSGSLSVTVGGGGSGSSYDDLNLPGNITLGGSQSYVQGSVNSGANLYQGIQVTASTVTLTGSAITLAGDVGHGFSTGNALTLNTSATNGPINLNISIGRPSVWYPLSSFTANAGTGAINWTGSYGSNYSQTTPITLTGALNFASNFSCWSSETMTLNATAPSTVTGTFSGPLALVVGGTSTLTITGSNTYTGATTANAGTLTVNGGITSSTTTVNSGATLSGTGATGAVTVASGGTLAPGFSGTGSLSLNNHALFLAGTAALEINQSTGAATQVQGISAMTYGGTLNITNLAGTLAAGNAFTLFSASTYSGSFATISLPALGSSLLWNTADLPINCSIIVTGSLPSGWAGSDIGSVGVPGYSAYSGTTYTIAGSGVGIGSTSDAFQFASEALTGDGDIRAQVTSETNTGANAMAGIMIRSGSGAGAQNALVALTPSKGFIFQSRATASGTTAVSGTAASYTVPNNWVRLTRSGTLISAYVSTSGTAWTEIGTVVTTMTNSVSVGLAVTSGSNTTASTATFTNVSMTPFPSPWQSLDIGSPGQLGSAEYYNGAFTLKGAGNIGGSADNFHYVYQSLSGTSGTLSAQISTLQNTGTSSTIGVMIRSALTSNSQYAFMGVTGSGTFETLTRASTGGGTTTTTSGSGTAPNLWVEVVLSGTALSGYESTDGMTWTLVTSTPISMGSNVYVGFADASGTTSTLNTSVFSNVTYTP